MAEINSDSTFIKIYDTSLQSMILKAKRLLVCELYNDDPIKEEERAIPVVENAQVLKCSYCNIVFDNLTQQREHYKLDWHRHNLSKRIEAQASITEEQFKLLSLDEVENLSDSDSSDDPGCEELTHRGYAFFKNEQQQVFSLYKCLTMNEECEIVECQKDKVWTVLMVSGGHFAGAVFCNGEIKIHKTFHSYTVRAKQGGSQASTDNRKGNAYPKSAGANLRRYNNSVFVQHIQDVLQEWKTYIDSSTFIFYRAAGPHNQAVLFGGKYPPLTKTCRSLKIIPFSTRRPTFAEVQHVYAKLSVVNVYSNRDEVLQMVTKSTATKSSKKSGSKSVSTPTKSNNRAHNKENEEDFSKKSQHQIDYEKTKPLFDESFQAVSSSSDELDFVINEEEICMVDALQAFSQTRKPRRRHKTKGNDRKTLIEATNAGNLELVQNLLTAKLKNLLNDPLDVTKNRLLHFASKNGHTNVITWLLEAGANPCLKNAESQTPFSVCKDIVIEEAFKRFANHNPDKYDYEKAGIPFENKVMRKKKEEKKQKKRDQDAIRKFLDQNDAEKLKSGLKRCFECGLQMEENRVPFQYSNFRFCSIECLKKHRVNNGNK